MEKISFDYAVVEKESSIQVMRFLGEWKDLGTWNTLTEAMEENVIGQAIENETCENVHVINELDIPILCMGCKDMVVSASPDGILVSNKEQSSYIKSYVEKIDQPIRFAEKSWGTYRVLDIEEESLTIKVILKSKEKMNYHNHSRRDEVWVVIAGTGYTILDGKKRFVQAGDVVTIPVGCRHTIIAETELKVIEVQLGKNISILDKQKFEFHRQKKCAAILAEHIILSTVQFFFIHRDRSVVILIFFHTKLCQIFQLGIQRTLVILGNVSDFIEQFRFKADARLDFVRRHDNTSFLI